jgi:hypothetical protein
MPIPSELSILEDLKAYAQQAVLVRRSAVGTEAGRNLADALGEHIGHFKGAAAADTASSVALKFPRFLRVPNLIAAAALIGVGIGIAAAFPEIPAKARSICFEAFPLSEPPPPPTSAQVNRILSGSLALVEAQHTYYAHVTRNTRFAASVRELGLRGDKGGVVMVREVWEASDAVSLPTPLHGYLFKILLLENGSAEKDGFIVAAYPDEKHTVRDCNRPVFLSIVPNAKGGLIGMSTAETWEIEDPKLAAAARELVISNTRVSGANLAKFNPKTAEKSFLLENFKKENR